jgi:hypothetical protein
MLILACSIRVCSAAAAAATPELEAGAISQFFPQTVRKLEQRIAASDPALHLPAPGTALDRAVLGDDEFKRITAELEERKAFATRADAGYREYRKWAQENEKKERKAVKPTAASTTASAASPSASAIASASASASSSSSSASSSSATAASAAVSPTAAASTLKRKRSESPEPIAD